MSAETPPPTVQTDVLRHLPPEPHDFPIAVGCVDAGSNAIRFLCVEFQSPTRFSTTHYERVPIRLGHQVFLNGELSEDAIDATIDAFKGFRQVLDDLEVRHFRAVATSAVREARNASVLVDRIARECAIEIDVISGSEEARLVHVAVASRQDLADDHWVLCDVGGGSVEVSLVDDVGMLWAESHTMGSVRLLEVLSGADGDPGRFQRLLTEYVSVLTLPTQATYLRPAGFIATGGNIETLAKLSAPVALEEPVARLSVQDLRASIELLSRLSYRDKMEQLDLREDRADVVVPAAMVYLRVAELCGVDTILVPHVGIKEGIVLDLMDDLVAHRSHEERQVAQLTKAAVALGRRFLFDEAHGLKVAELADALFDQLASLHGLDFDDRLRLRAAAILHDIGLFISYKKHHKHSLYILKELELPGFAESDMMVIANVARYHRKAGPSEHHLEYSGLAPIERVRVSQLASLLRLADGLDRQHMGKVRKVAATVRGLELWIDIEGDGDLLLERWAVARKKDVFEQTFGLKVCIGEGFPSP